MPAIIARSIAILSDAGLGMAMFSLGNVEPLIDEIWIQDSKLTH